MTLNLRMKECSSSDLDLFLDDLLVGEIKLRDTEFTARVQHAKIAFGRRTLGNSSDWEKFPMLSGDYEQARFFYQQLPVKSGFK